ncbi:MAG TPA: NAD+ synthase [Methylomirabilota bacterium]|nr:NAD+ synthase [Methylomirabilota bacterium]
MTLSTPDTLRLALAQLNPVMGDIPGNIDRARSARARAAALGADAVVLTELFVCGYTPEDLVLKPALQRDCRFALEAFAAETADGGPAVVIGTPWAEDGKLYNAVAVLDGGRIDAIRFKVDLPNYGVFDEKRVFAVGPMPGPVNLRGIRVGLPICEDIWGEEIVECLVETGAELLVVINGSPYWHGKFDERLHRVVARVVESGLPIAYVNQVCGQDELVFDGASFGVDADYALSFQMPAFHEDLALVTYARGPDGRFRVEGGPMATLPDPSEADWRACVLGLRDYVNKNGFKAVVLGLSGGIDSAICAAMAVDALGPERVRCLMMPYRYTSSTSLEDAEACARALGVSYEVVPIAAPVEGFLEVLKPVFKDLPPDTSEENLQSRVRGTLLMAVSNKFGPMVVTTGNKSEVSVGYATLYGDMNGGFNPIKDLYKTEVYRLSAWRNAHHLPDLLGPGGEVIPERIITKAPTAELRENQTDQDSLPPYDVLDGILACLVEEEMTLADVVARGFDLATVRRVEHLLYIAEYKRRQAAPGVKITRRNFGRDRRYPITNRYRDRG